MEKVPKTSCLKRKFFKTLRCCRAGHNFTKTRAQVRLDWRSAENSDVFAGKHLWWKLLISKNACLETIPAFYCNRVHSRDYRAWVVQGISFQYFEKLSARYHCCFLSTWDCNFTEDDLFRIHSIQNELIALKIFQLCERQCLYLNADADANTEAKMLIPKFPNSLLAIYQGLFRD